MEIIEVMENKKNYIELLLLADEQEDMIDRYIDARARRARGPGAERPRRD